MKKNEQTGQLDRRLDDMLRIADATGYSLDAVVAAVGRADQRIFAAVSDKPSLLPRYIQSRDRP